MPPPVRTRLQVIQFKNAREGQEETPWILKHVTPSRKTNLPRPLPDSASWVSGHRSGVLRWVIVGGVALVVAVGALIFWNLRSTAADTALGAAMDTYNAPLAQPGLPVGNGIYATSADRTKAANSQFAAVAKDYGWLPQGTKARYFSGITDEELGQNASAETELKAAVGRLGSQSCQPGQTRSCRPLSPNLARLPGHRHLQRARCQAL